MHSTIQLRSQHSSKLFAQIDDFCGTKVLLPRVEALLWQHQESRWYVQAFLAGNCDNMLHVKIILPLWLKDSSKSGRLVNGDTFGHPARL